jgi:AcrR family transcriptional regulator
MARTVKADAVALKRKEILDTAQRLVFTKGFAQMSIQDILDEIQMSNGGFHHYFNSRAAMLEALIQRMEVESGKPLLPIIHDPHLNAIEKLQGFFDALNSLGVAHAAEVIKLLLIWYSDENVLVRVKVDEAAFEQRVPLINEIVRQGVQEGIFTVAFPDQAGEVIQSLLQGMGNAHARLILLLARGKDGVPGAGDDTGEIVDRIITTHSTYMDAIERVIGAPTHSLRRMDAAAVDVWLEALRDNKAA